MALMTTSYSNLHLDNAAMRLFVDEICNKYNCINYGNAFVFNFDTMFPKGRNCLTLNPDYKKKELKEVMIVILKNNGLILFERNGIRFHVEFNLLTIDDLFGDIRRRLIKHVIGAFDFITAYERGKLHFCLENRKRKIEEAMYEGIIAAYSDEIKTNAARIMDGISPKKKTRTQRLMLAPPPTTSPLILDEPP